ncbi:MAG: hypothetical protein K9K65_08835 [Desulfarculaceae bacterium]|nr:hypothetical protein [Desulfarculaceae bacterium]MCF8097932.1 hypothetical protein [Desulfarculaceae bacterium]
MGQKTDFRPGAVAQKLDIPTRRLLHWRQTGYAPATGKRSPGGGIATYTLDDAIGCGLLQQFWGQGGFSMEAAQGLKDQILSSLDRIVGDRSRPGSDHWLLVSGKTPIILAPSGLQDDLPQFKGRVKFTLFDDVNLFVDPAMIARLPGRNSLAFFNVTQILNDLIERLARD